jgi:hypothetical protein
LLLILILATALPSIPFPVHAQPKVVYVLHDSPSTWNFLIGPLQQAGLSVAIGASPDLNSIDALIVFRESILSRLSSSALLNFVSRGGGILFTAGTGSGTPEYGSINQVSSNFGVTYLSEDGMRDANQNDYALSTDGFVVGGLVVRDLSSHDITNGVSQVVMWNYMGNTPPAVPVMRVSGANVIARFSSTAYSTDGAYTTGSRPPAIVTTQSGRGRIVAISSDAHEGGPSISSTWGRYDNQRLIVNAAVWLVAPGLASPSQQQNVQIQSNQPQPPASTRRDDSGMIVLVVVLGIVIVGVVAFLAGRRSKRRR